MCAISIAHIGKRPDTVSFQHFLQLLGEAHLAVMPLLVLDIPHRVFQLRYTDGEGPISILPRKSTTLKVVVDPFGRTAFNQLHGLCDGHGCRQRDQHMDMVRHAAHGNGCKSILRAMPAMYGQSLSLMSAGMVGRRCFVEKTQWARML